MAITKLQQDHAEYLEQASELLEAPARAVTFEWDVERIVRKHIKLDDRRGLVTEHPIIEFWQTRDGQVLEAGMERYTWDIGGEVLRLVYVTVPNCNCPGCALHQFWAVPIDQYQSLYRAVRSRGRKAAQAVPPVMASDDQERLWRNTVGFLARGREMFRRYGVPQKRGVLLLGEPGNGKTMACRWLCDESRRKGLAWRTVNIEDYEAARQSGSLRSLFYLRRSGIILFDDFDLGIRDREKVGPTFDHTMFLSELDGFQRRQGVVYLFTSNAQQSDLDPAFLRSGRIDLVLQFPRPSAHLRRQFITAHWHNDIVDHIDVRAAVEQAHGLSFAELEEVRRLLVMRYLEQDRWDWDWAWQTFRAARGDVKRAGPIGFCNALTGSEEQLEA